MMNSHMFDCPNEVLQQNVIVVLFLDYLSYVSTSRNIWGLVFHPQSWGSTFMWVCKFAIGCWILGISWRDKVEKKVRGRQLCRK